MRLTLELDLRQAHELGAPWQAGGNTLMRRYMLQGRAATYYLKQLAQHGVRDILPQARLFNAIEVD